MFLRATLTGSIAVLIWGMALPVTRLLQEQIGLLALLGIVNGASGLIGLARLKLINQPLPDFTLLTNPRLHLRWGLFVLHTVCIVTAVFIVERHHIPFVLLVNYIWPTAIIVFSVLYAGVQITRWLAFLTGTVIVLASLGMEIVGPHGFSSGLFDKPSDCLAYAIAFVGALAWGLYSALSRRDGDTTGGSSVIPFFQLTLFLALPVALFTGVHQLGELRAEWALAIAGYCLFNFAAYLTWDYGIRRGNVIVLSLFADFIPWLSLAGAWLLLQTPVAWSTAASAVTLVFGAAITRYGTLRRPSPRTIVEQHVTD